MFVRAFGFLGNDKLKENRKKERKETKTETQIERKQVKELKTLNKTNEKRQNKHKHATDICIKILANEGKWIDI